MVGEEVPASTRVVAAAQLGPASAGKADTVARMVDLIDAAGAAQVQLLVFPELSLTPYFAAAIRADTSEFVEKEFPSDVTAPIVAAVARNRITTVVPFAELTDVGLFNSAALLDPFGSEVGRYRKMHIPGTVEPVPDRPFQIFEKRYFLPGDLGFPAYATPVGAVGMAICYDRRFPETYRCLALGGAEVLAVMFNTPYDQAIGDGRQKAIEAHELAVRAGALSNGVPVIASGKVGLESGTAFIGASSVISHTGEVLARAAGDSDELVVAEVDLHAAAQARAQWNSAADRRPEQYALLTHA